jgi:hypothetical protein
MKKLLYTYSILLLVIVAANAQSNNTGAGISLAFNGNTGNYVDLGDVFNSLNFPFSIEAWVKLDQYSPSSTAYFLPIMIL